MESPLPGAGGIWGEYIKIQNGLLNLPVGNNI